MSLLHDLLAEVVTVIESSGLCTNTQILETAAFTTDQFTFKIRTSLFSSYTLQIRIYFNKGVCDYSYQVLDREPLCRWDNKEHFQNLKTAPHHHHSVDGKVVESPLKGEPIPDLRLVLAELARLFKNRA